MSRQLRPADASSATRSGRPAAPAVPGRSRRAGIGRRMAAVLATGLLIGWNSPLLGPAAVAQQTPDSWSAERRAALPSGLRVQLDFSPLPGVTAKGATGKLATGGGGYADGLRGGDPATAFELGLERPTADGSWRTLGTLQLSFSGPVRNPRLHLSGLAAQATGRNGSTSTVSRLTVTGGSPSAPSLVARTDWPGWTVSDNALTPADAGEGAEVAQGPGQGTVELSGTVSTVTFRLEQRSTARGGSAPAPAALRQAYTVTLDEGVGSAPQGYTNASHLVSDLFLGRTATPGARPATATVARPLVPEGPAGPQEPEAVLERSQPMVELDGGESRRSTFERPSAGGPQPGRGDYQGPDPTVDLPAEAAIGRYYTATVPVAAASGPATLAGWIDFDHNGRFDATERVQAEVTPGQRAARLEWIVPGNAAAGETWARLRLAHAAAQVVNPGGFADSGEVLDQKVRLTVGAARPEITGPVSGSVLADARPEIRGEAGVAGATVAVLEGERELCRATVARDGGWACRPDQPLRSGEHVLVPVETTRGGVVLRGEEIRLTVKTDPPRAPQFTLPEYTNDPGLLLTGTADPGTTVSVVDAPRGPGADRAAGELCSSATQDDGTWSCLPVENLADGPHQLTAAATDGAGNRTAGKPVPLVVDTVAPPRPQLGSPASGAVLDTARPRLTGRAEPGSTVTVTARPRAAGERFVLCTAVTGADGAWSCTAARDLAEGAWSVVVTATDRAGNTASADAADLTVRPTAVSPSPSEAPVESPSPSPSGAPSPSPSPSASPSPSPSPSPSSSPSPSPEPTPSASPSESSSVSASPSVSASAVAAGSPSASTSPEAPPASPSVSPSGPTEAGTLPLPSGSPSLLPMVPASAQPSPSGEPVEPPFTEPVLTPDELAVIVPIVVPGGGTDPSPPDASPSASPAVPTVSAPAAPSPAVPVEPSASASPSATPSESGGPVSAKPSASPSTTPEPGGPVSSESAVPVAAPSSEPAAPVVSATPTISTPSPSVTPSAPSDTRTDAPSVTPSVAVVPPASPAASAEASPSATPSPSPSPSTLSSPSPSASPSPHVSASAAGATSVAVSPEPGGAPADEAPVIEAAGPPAPAAEPAPSPSETGPESRNLAAPPVGAMSEAESWRTGAFGLLLVATALGLLAKRVLSRGSGGRRRR
ncbi:Ig-like domain-containing protein [Kitasatospora sp. NPDC096147]|uniref:Ig-like domain-containing protein n=1 Tax=Kitasatospora sp. NPDC096147 TaxID=3364093 RepID=UPI0038007126